MKTKKKYLVIIPARKNSKGLQNKNKLIFNKKPLFYWPIIAANNSKFINKIVVTSDDVEILSKKKNFNKKIDFIRRPNKYAKANSSSSEFIIHALNYLEKKNEYYDYIILLEPTSPLTTSGDIKKVVEMMNNDRKIDSVVSISLNNKLHPSFNYTINKKNIIKPITMEKINKVVRRQDLDKFYYLDGSIYASKVSTYKKHKTFIHNKTIGITLEPYKSIEIDSMIDFISAEAIIKNIKIL